MTPPKPHSPVAPAPAVFAMVVGVVAGAGCLIWSRWLVQLLGDTDSTLPVLFLLGAVGLALGLQRDALGRRAVTSAGRTIGTRWMALGALTLALSWVDGSGTLLSWVSVPADAGRWISLAAQLALGGLILIPVGFAAGSSLRCAARFSKSFSTSLPWGVLGAALGAATITGLRIGDIFTDAAMGLAVGLAGILLGFNLLIRWHSNEGSAEPADVPTSTPWGAAGVGLLLFSLAQIGPRIMAPVFGNDLPSVPIADFAFLVAVAIGVAVGLVASGRITPPATIGVVQGLVALAGTSAIFLLGNYTLLPERFAALAATESSFDDLWRAGLGLVAWRLGIPGFLLGVAVALVASAGRQSSARPLTWFSRSGMAAMAGGMLGTALPAATIPTWGIQGLLACVAIGSVLAVTLAVARSSLPGLAKLGLVLVSPGVVAAAVLQVPAIDSDRVLVDRDRQSSGAALPTTPQKWPEYEGEDRRLSAVVLRRGHQKRLLVNGRWEMGRETATKAHGMLAHLPLSVHPAPERVLILGAGTGWSVRSAVAHPARTIQCFETSARLVEAARSFGPAVAEAFADTRLGVTTGDPHDLLLRSDPFDVIVSHASGAWTDRSAAVCTREFLSAAHDRLTTDGLFAQWVPSESLTKSGFQILLATYASVFPQVQVWDAGTGDVILLAKKNAAPHDFERLLASYRQPVIQRAMADSWIATPETMLSHFLIDDATVRRISGGSPVHSRRDPQLGRAEAARRRVEPSVDPVPGLAALRTDVTDVFANTPPVGFRVAIQNVTRARDLERIALGFEQNLQPYDAADAYQEAMELNPRDRAIRRGFATLRSQMGVNYANRENFTAAHAYLREAVETDTTYAAGFANLGRLLLNGEDYDYAISVMQQAINVAPDDDLFLLQLGRTWKTRGYLDKALPFYARAMEINPLNVDVGLGYIDTKLAMQGDSADLQEGLDFLEVYLEIEPFHEELLNRVGKFRDALRREPTEAQSP